MAEVAQQETTSPAALLPAERWQDSVTWGASLVAVYVALALLPVTLAFALEPATGKPFLMELGKGAGLTGFALLTLQVVLSARLRVVDAPVGQDMGDGRPVVLVCGNKREQDIIRREELGRLPKNVKVVHVLSRPGEGWQGLRGYVSGEVIRENAEAVLDEADVYVCGPPVMMDMVIRELRELGVDDNRIHYERFAV